MPPESSKNAPTHAWPAYLRQRSAQSRSDELKAFYQQGFPDPGTPIDEVPLVALDLETTGLHPNRDSIVSIGIVPFTIDRIQASERYYQVVRPRRALKEESIVIHHITHSEIAQAPDLDTVFNDILERLAGRIPVVHYHRIERPFLDQAAQLRFNEPLRFPVLDTMMFEARLHRQSLRARLRQWLGATPRSIRLQESRARYNLPTYTGHHALLDALATAELFQAQVAHRLGRKARLGDLWI